MKVFIDTNILVDITDSREFAQEGRMIFQLGVRGDIEVCASYLTFANLNYILRNRSCAERYKIIRQLRQGLLVLPCDTKQLDLALSEKEVRDFEDMLQYQCALASGCDVIVTNNIRDYRDFCQVPCMTSRNFLLDYFSQH